MSLGSGTKRVKSIVINDLNEDTYVGRPALIRVKKDKQQLQEIAFQMQSFVMKKKNLAERYRQLRLDMELKDGEWLKKVNTLKATYEQKIRDLRAQNARQKQNVEDLQMRFGNCVQNQHKAEENYEKVCLDRNKYESQLTDTQTALVAATSERRKLELEISKLGRAKNMLQDKVNSLHSQNATIIFEKSTLQKQIESSNSTSIQYQKEAEKLRSELMKNTAKHKRDMTELRTAFKEKGEKLEVDYKKKLESFCRMQGEVYDKDKKTWMKIFRAEAETKMHSVSELNTRLEENSKKLEKENDQFQSTISLLKSQIGTMKMQNQRKLSKSNEESGEKYNKLVLKHKSEISNLITKKDNALKELGCIQRELDELKMTSDQKLQDATRTIRLQERKYEKLKQELAKKNNQLHMLKSKHVDYFQEINALQQVLAEAEECGTTSEGNNRMLLSEIRSLKNQVIVDNPRGGSRERSRSRNR